MREVLALLTVTAALLLHGACGCEPDEWGPDCAPCPAGCADQPGGAPRCDDVTGKCHSCQAGFFGDQCDQDCPAHCVCDQLSGQNCTTCLAGFYGPVCDAPCPNHCLSDFCSRSSGACLGKCISYYYGSYCNVSCPTNCRWSSCESDSGLCSYGCQQGYFGSKCEQKCSLPSCFSCDGDAPVCTSCPIGFYGSTCSNACPANCRVKDCNFTTGLCDTGCSSGYCGAACDGSCSDLTTTLMWTAFAVALVLLVGLACCCVYVQRLRNEIASATDQGLLAGEQVMLTAYKPLSEGPAAPVKPPTVSLDERGVTVTFT